MIQQDRFLRLLAAIDAYEEVIEGYARAFDQANALKANGGSGDHAFGVVAGYHAHHPHPLSNKTRQAISDERAHFKVNAKRNDRARTYKQAKKDLTAHNEYVEQTRRPTVTPWAGKIDAPIPPVVAKVWTREEMHEMNEAAKLLPMPQEPEHIREVREKMLEAMKLLPEGKSLQIPDDEILGDVEEDFNPFA